MPQDARAGADLEEARAALGRHAWREAFDLLSKADAESELSPDGLELLAQSAWWVGQLPVSIEARERAYAAAMKIGDNASAVLAAIRLGNDNLLRNARSVANAWLNRAERLLQGQDESLGHGWLASARSFYWALVGDPERSLSEAERAQDIAVRLGDRDLEAMAMSERGASLVALGNVAEGLILIDEATVAAVGGELEPGVAGGVCCATIEACASVGDWERATQWTEAQDRWCKREGIQGFPGMCRVFRSEIKRMHGSWLEAETEARQASVELEGFIPAAVGTALYQIAEIRLRRGDLPAAEELLLRAHALGTDPEPALSLLRLAQGDAPAALASIRHALTEPRRMLSWRAPPDTALHRLPLLQAQVEIALAVKDLETARSAAEELMAFTSRYESATLKAAAAAAIGAIEIAEGDLVSGARDVQRAVEHWAEVDAPYERARARMLLAEAFMAEGDKGRAIVEAQAARAAFDRLGAVADLARAEEILGTLEQAGTGPTRAAGERVTRTFVFTDIVDSTKLAEVLGDEAWNDLIRWHDQVLRSLVARYGGEEIKRTGDGFFLAFDDPDRAIDAAIATQRRLAGQRREQGFAPAIRIGVHLAEASRSGLDYHGTGVNQAARVAAAASGEEIFVSSRTLANAKRSYLESGRQTLELKGLAEPVEVVSIDWR
ncbi:MAG: adenylate/guanylate cyclase domain-containing protein [Acidimicrobiia bacterium]